MPVRFSSESDSFLTFKNVAVRMLRLAGHSGTVPSVIPADQVAQALDALKAGVERVAAEERTAQQARKTTPETDEEDEEMVSIRQRAFPLIRLMAGALEDGSDVRFVEE